MKTVVLTAIACVALLSTPIRLFAQAPAERPISEEALLKLKHKALEQTRTVSIPPETKSALRLKENAGKTTCKQLVAGDANKKYYFIVPTDMNSDDVFLSTQEANGDVHMFMTNSNLDLINS